MAGNESYPMATSPFSPGAASLETINPQQLAYPQDGGLRTPPNNTKALGIAMNYYSSDLSGGSSSCASSFHSITPQTPALTPTSSMSGSSFDSSRRPSQVSMATDHTPLYDENVETMIRGDLDDSDPCSMMAHPTSLWNHGMYSIPDKACFQATHRDRQNLAFDNYLMPRVESTTQWVSNQAHRDQMVPSAYPQITRPCETTTLSHRMGLPSQTISTSPIRNFHDFYQSDETDVPQRHIKHEYQEEPTVNRNTVSGIVKSHTVTSKKSSKITKKCGRRQAFAKSQKKKTFLCSKCHSPFERQEHLHRHLKTHNEEKEKLPCFCPFQCEEKPKKKHKVIMDRPDNRKSHIIRTHFMPTDKQTGDNTNKRFDMLQTLDTVYTPVSYSRWLDVLKIQDEKPSHEDMRRRIRKWDVRWQALLSDSLTKEHAANKRSEAAPVPYTGFWRMLGWNVEMSMKTFVKDLAPEYEEEGGDPMKMLWSLDPRRKAMEAGKLTLKDTVHLGINVQQSLELGLRDIDIRWQLRDQRQLSSKELEDHGFTELYGDSGKPGDEINDMHPKLLAHQRRQQQVDAYQF